MPGQFVNSGPQGLAVQAVFSSGVYILSAADGSRVWVTVTAMYYSFIGVLVGSGPRKRKTGGERQSLWTILRYPF